MPVSPFDSEIYGGLLSDAEAAELFTDEADLRAMLEFEAALARAEAAEGVIPAEAASRIESAVREFRADTRALREETATTGMPIPGLVAQLREAVGGNAASYVHWGATSQDVIDTSLVLRLRRLLDLLDARLAGLTGRLAALADQHRRTVMLARTRSQQATPTSFGLKLAGWLAPLQRHRTRLAELRPRLLVLQFGGATGNLAALGDRGIAVMERLGYELDLPAPPMAWHTQRDGLAELGGWFSLVCGSLGKMGQDLVLLAHSEVSEVRAGAGGGSSTLPQKANPIGAETLVTLARLTAGLLGTLHQAMIQEHERGGSGWTLEWTVLPQMAIATAAALRHARILADTMEVDAGRMAANLEASNGLVLAEAASFALSAHMPRAEAQALVKEACRTALREGSHLVDVLAGASDAPVAWDELRDPARCIGVADALIERVLASVR